MKNEQVEDSVYAGALAVVRELRAVMDAVHEKDADLGRQTRRAASSVVLNIAEANGCRGGNSRLRFGTACGSAKELMAALEVAGALGYVGEVDASVMRRLDRVAARTFALSRR